MKFTTTVFAAREIRKAEREVSRPHLETEGTVRIDGLDVDGARDASETRSSSMSGGSELVLCSASLL